MPTTPSIRQNHPPLPLIISIRTKARNVQNPTIAYYDACCTASERYSCPIGASIDRTIWRTCNPRVRSPFRIGVAQRHSYTILRYSARMMPHRSESHTPQPYPSVHPSQYMPKVARRRRRQIRHASSRRIVATLEHDLPNRRWPPPS